MSIELWLAFVAASAVLLVIPGPTILTVISYSVSYGRRAKVPLVAAVALGDRQHSLTLVGSGALLANVGAFWFTIVKSVGGLYLLYLGIKLLRAGISPAELVEASVPESRWRFSRTRIWSRRSTQGHRVLRRFPGTVHQSECSSDAAALDSRWHIRGHGHHKRDVVRDIRRLGSRDCWHRHARRSASSRWRFAAFARGHVGPAGEASGLTG